VRPRGPDARMRSCVRTDALIRPWTVKTRLRVKPHGGINADAGGRPDDVRGRLDEKDVRTVIFIQNRPL
jgi:hypothetical protein